MFAVDELKHAGFNVWLDGENIRYKQIDERPINRALINNLLQDIRQCKQKAILYLQQKPAQTSDPAFVDQGQDTQPPKGTASRVADLERRIFDALKGRPLPIQISQCESIIGIEKFAKAESRDAYHQSKYVRTSAREHLAALGLNLEDFKS